MTSATSSKYSLLRAATISALAVILSLFAAGQQPAPTNWTAEQDHQNMMDQLGIKALRPGPSGNEKDPNHANYDETKADIYGDLPDALTMKNGQKVTSAEQWWKQRRPEIVEDFEREVIGRVPPNVPKVSWSVKTSAEFEGRRFLRYRKTVDRTRGQLSVSIDQRRHHDDAGHAGECERPGAGDDHVQQRGDPPVYGESSGIQEDVGR